VFEGGLGRGKIVREELEITKSGAEIGRWRFLDKKLERL